MARFEIRDHVDAYAARRGVRGLGQKLGFSRNVCQELEIVVSELSSNIVKYGVRGAIELFACSDERAGAGIEIVAEDVGPPFHDLALALRDGHDDRGPIDPGSLLKRGGLGAGLGAVDRLSDSLNVEYEPGGKRIRVRRFLKPPLGKRGRAR